MKKTLAALACATLLAGVSSAFADENTLDISVPVKAGCHVKFANPTIAFDTIDPNQPFNGQSKESTFTAGCGEAGAKVSLNDGDNANGGTQRYLAVASGGADKILYNVYQGKGTSGKLWNSTADGIYTTTDGNTAMDFTVAIPADSVTGKKLPDGNYTDHLIATATFLTS